MERTRTIKVLQLMFLALLLVVVSSWYSHMNTIEIVTDQNKEKIESNKALKFFKNYNNKRNYYKSTETLYRVKRTVIPFVYDKEIIKTPTSSFISEDCGC